MAKPAKVLCDRCESRIIAGVSYCPRCGYPTQWASHEERTRWEVSQWKTADRSQGEDAPAKGSQRRRVLPRPFARKTADKPALTLVSPQATPSAGRPVPDTEPAPEPVAKPAVAIERPAPPRKITLEPTSQVTAPAVTPRAGDSDPVEDAPRTVMAMRLLNARVAELHDRVQKLERELADSRRERSLTN